MHLSQTKSLHLLRALLREASYLPDASARTYFRRYIVNRFRAYQPKHLANTSRDSQAIERYSQRAFKRRDDAIVSARASAMHRKGQKGLNYLRRAVQGEYMCLEKILLLTYGRLGRRKHALLEGLLKPDVPEDHAELEPEPGPLQKLYYSNARYLSIFDAPRLPTTGPRTHYHIAVSERFSRLQTILQTQHAAGIHRTRKLKSPFLKSPVTNIWHRPMPIKRARNIARKWYAEAMSGLFPPMPNEEWDGIKAMIDGTKHIAFAKRRTPARVLNPEPVQEDVAFTALVNDAIAMNKPSKADRPEGTKRPHFITTRFMRRLYARIFPYCCKLDWNSDRNQWRATWGTNAQPLSPRIYSAPVDPALFDGVDDAGQIPRQEGELLTGKERSTRVKKKHITVPFHGDHLTVDHTVHVLGR